VDEYGDFTCPTCQRFQTTMGPTIEGLVGQGRSASTTTR
jgi:hypothetical protein